MNPSAPHPPDCASQRTWWPHAIVAALAVFALGTGILIVIACRNPTDLVRADYYEQEIRHQAQMEREARTRTLGERARIGFDAGRAELTITVPPEQMRGEFAGQIQLYRPAAAGQDRLVPLSPDTTGRQVLPAGDLAPGLWRVRVWWRAGWEEFYLEERIIIPTNGVASPPGALAS